MTIIHKMKRLLFMHGSKLIIINCVSCVCENCCFRVIGCSFDYYIYHDKTKMEDWIFVSKPYNNAGRTFTILKPNKFQFICFISTSIV